MNLRAILHVNNCLDLFDEKHTARQHVEGLSELVNKDGFHLPKFISNDLGPLELISANERLDITCRLGVLSAAVKPDSSVH